VDEQWDLGKGLVALAAPPGTVRRSGHHRVHRRRHILCGKKRGACVGKTKRGKGTKLLLLVDHQGLPWGAHVASASPHEVTLIEPLLQERQLHRLPKHLLYDLAADSDPLRTRLLRRGIQLICPHRTNRTKPPTQDGRRFRRYKRRYRVERTIGWIQHFRRILVRYERHVSLFLGFVQLACFLILMKRF
jgi:transposase